LFNKLDLDNPDANFYLTLKRSSMWKYHRSCWSRLLAYCQYVHENGDTLYSDYDVMNYGLSPKILSSTKSNSLFCRSRCVVFLGRDGAKDIERVMYDFSKKNFKEEALPESFNDMMIMHQNLSHKDNTSNFSLKLYPNGEQYCSNISPDFSNSTPLVHFDGGCFQRGMNKNMSRLEVVEKYEKYLCIK